MQPLQDQNTQTILNAFNEQNERINEHKQVVDKVLELVSKQYDHVSISDVRTEHWQRVERFLHLRVLVQPPPSVATATTATAVTVPSFAWDARSEPQHFNDYLQYLQQYIDLAGTDLTWNRQKPSTHLLDIYAHPALPFRVKGSTDCFICKTIYYEGNAEPSGLIMLFELKKGEISNENHYQAMMQLLCADLLSNFTPFVVLTNLNNDWRIYHISSSTSSHDQQPDVKVSIVQWKYRSNGDAIDMINCILRVQQSDIDNEHQAPLAMRHIGISTFRLSSIPIQSSGTEADPMVDLLDMLEGDEKKECQMEITMRQLQRNPYFQQFFHHAHNEVQDGHHKYEHMFS
jgi:hypothetical protein